MKNLTIKSLFVVISFVCSLVGIAQSKIEVLDKNYQKGEKYILMYDGQRRNTDVLEKSIVYFNKSIKKNKYAGGSYLMRGVAYLYLGEIEKAINDYTVVIGLVPDNCELYRFRGDAYIMTQRYTDALNDFQKSLQKGCEEQPLLLDIANTYRKAKNYKSAIYYMSKAIVYDTADVMLYDSRGSLYLITKEYDKAILDFSKAISKNPRYFNAFNGRGLAYNGMKEYEKAIADYEESIRLQPINYFENDHVEYVWNNMGNSYFAMGNKEKACECWKKAVDIGYIYLPEWKEQYLIDSPHDLLKWHCQ